MVQININKTEKSKLKKETLRIKGNKMHFNLNAFRGKQGDFIVYFSPALNISGYGKTDKEASDFFKIEIQLFCDDVMGMSIDERNNYLASIGFKKERYRNKNFSKAFVDRDGVLQNFDKGSVELKLLQTA